MSKHSPLLSAKMRMRPTPSAAARFTIESARSKSRGRSMCPFATIVVRPTSDVSNERGGGGSVCPDSAASAAASVSASDRPFPPAALTYSRIASAVGVKYGRSSSSTSDISCFACTADDVITSAGVGALIDLNVTPVSRTIVRRR